MRHPDPGPRAVLSRVRRPDGTETTYTYGTEDAVIRASAGVYAITVVFDEASDGDRPWAVRFVGQGIGGTSIASEEQEVLVRASAFATP